MARALITGAAGFIGSTLAERLLGNGHEVVGVDCFTDYYNPAIKKNNLSRLLDNKKFHFIDKDLIEIDVSSLGRFDYVFHLAAQPGVRASWGRTFDNYIRNNIAATQKLLEDLKSSNIKKLVYASSSSIYGNRSGLLNENTIIPQPYSPYGATKLTAEHFCGIYHMNYGLPTISLRFFTVYGPRQRPDMAFCKFIVSALTGKKITIYGDGNQTRDFTYVDDVVLATIKAAESDVYGQIMNIGGGHAVSINQVLELLGQISGTKVDVSHLPRQRGDVDHTEADTSRARHILGFDPKIKLEEGLSRQFQYVKENLPLYAD